MSRCGAFLLGLAVSASGCGEPRPERSERAVETSGPAEAARGVAGHDTASPVPYHIFEQTVESADPKRVTLRFLLLDPRSEPHVSRTLRSAFDSLAKADSQLVAARAVVYAPRPGGGRQADLVPIAWGMWVPPEGWTAADRSSRRRIHRSYVYFGVSPDTSVIGSGLAP